MSLYRDFKPTSDLPTASQTGLPEVVVQEVNEGGILYKIESKARSGDTQARLHQKIMLPLESMQLKMVTLQLLRSCHFKLKVDSSTTVLMYSHLIDC